MATSHLHTPPPSLSQLPYQPFLLPLILFWSLGSIYFQSLPHYPVHAPSQRNRSCSNKYTCPTDQNHPSLLPLLLPFYHHNPANPQPEHDAGVETAVEKEKERETGRETGKQKGREETVTQGVKFRALVILCGCSVFWKGR